jgi:hypothetical protein
MTKIRSAGATTIGQQVFFDKRLSYEELGLLCQLLSLPDGWEYSVAGLAALKNSSADKVRKLVKCLEEKGYIRRMRERREDGTFGEMNYIISDTPVTGDLFSSDSPTLDSPTLDSPTLVNPAQYNNNIYNNNIYNNNNNTLPDNNNSKYSYSNTKSDYNNISVIDEKFVEFWEAYEKKVAKKAALKAWKALKPTEKLADEIISDVKQRFQSEQWRRERHQYAPNASTYLNGRRWEDAKQQQEGSDNYIDYENYVPTEDYRLI